MKRFVIAELSVVPVGTGSTGLSKYIAAALREVKRAGVKYKLGPTSTVFEADIDRALKIAKAAHQAVIDAGVNRVITTLRVDERLDTPKSMEERVRRVLTKVR
ncbi:MAG: MTH1187 family thiamine-binding protein [Candidatus Hodarchaeaceae archaeon]|nr:MTH1187 family thiamine-binding protein [Candidatus Hodarchaeaceae archaeon]